MTKEQEIRKSLGIMEWGYHFTCNLGIRINFLTYQVQWKYVYEHPTDWANEPPNNNDEFFDDLYTISGGINRIWKDIIVNGKKQRVKVIPD